MMAYLVMHGGFLHDDGGDQVRAVCLTKERAEAIASVPQVSFGSYMVKSSDLYILEVNADVWLPQDPRG